MQNSFPFQRGKRFFFKSATLHISKINSILDLKLNKRLLYSKALELDTARDTTCRLHGPMTSNIHMFVVTPVELISKRIKNNKTQDYIHKCNGIPFCEEKNDLKLSILQPRKMQKMSITFQGNTYILLTLPTIKKIKNGSYEVE